MIAIATSISIIVKPIGTPSDERCRSQKGIGSPLAAVIVNEADRLRLRPRAVDERRCDIVATSFSVLARGLPTL